MLKVSSILSFFLSKKLATCLARQQWHINWHLTIWRFWDVWNDNSTHSVVKLYLKELQIIKVFFTICYTYVGSSHIQSFIIGVEYRNCCRTLNVYLLFALLLGQTKSKLNYRLVSGQSITYLLYVNQFWLNLPHSNCKK